MTDGQTGGEQVFLVPIDQSNFERTVASPVDPADHPDRPEALSDAEGTAYSVGSIQSASFGMQGTGSPGSVSCN
jgi:hypothetical protein